MGAVDFTTYQQAATMSQAYANAVNDAEYDSGHDSYNGTISTTNGFKDATRDYVKLLERERVGSVKWRTNHRDDEGHLVFEEIDKHFKDMTEKQWQDKCIEDFKDEAHSKTNKWEECWGAKIINEADGNIKSVTHPNCYVFAGMAAC